MRNIGKLFCALAALSVGVAPAVHAKDDKIPPELAAKRSGKVKQATPSPLDMIYTAIPPCRVFYTPSAVAAGATRTFQVTGSGNLSSQGGPATGCGIPAYAKAVAISLSAVNPAANGSFKAYAAGASLPPTTALNYRANINETGGATIALGGSGGMSVLTTSSARIIGDVTGYYAPQLWAYVSADGILLDSSGRVTSVTKVGVGQYDIYFDRDIQSCIGTASPDIGAIMIAVYTYGNRVSVNLYTSSTTFVDYWFNLAVKC